jgi:predicted RNA binding protein YcfA (HicA-like mRNA interferase family)
MSRLPSCTAAQVIRALKRARFVFDHSTGSHQAFRRPDQPGSVVVAFHRGELKRGTLNGIIKQARLTPEEFIKLLRG